MSKAVILLGDMTDHGSKVITVIDEYIHNSVPIVAENKINRRR
ncbi:hypothetical protein [Photorhabdus noenieputensis]|nr:hypothetical protein [Photorhabdus noenieputensis]